ncbi:MAG: hypothetical protein ACK553_03720 [Planctomycetota bacterium]|jgi:hypothetical protein
MTSFSRLVFVSASHALEDLPKGIGSAHALDYLTAWTSLWDPRLLVALGAVPEWRRCDTSGLDLEDALICCPEASLAKLDQPLEERLRLGRNELVPSARRPRQDVVRSLVHAFRDRCSATGEVEKLALSREDHACSYLDDFYAFGYAVLQIQCMARKLRYSFNLDWMAVGEQILSAAKASVIQDETETDRWLSAAFDSLSQERDRYCSQQGNLLDLLLVAPTTLGNSLTHMLEIDRPLTIYATTGVLRAWQQVNPQAWNQLVQRLQDKSACLAGGLRDELPHVWLPEDALIRELSLARKDCEGFGIAPTQVWMRFAPSIPMNLATIARQFGFQGAILAPLGGGSVPKKDHAKIRWQGTGDRGGLDCILGHVLDVADAETILHLGNEMAQQLDYHQVPTLVLGHWPGPTSLAFQDLVKASRRTPVLGKWIHAESYFASTSQPYWTDPFTSLDFHHPLPHEPAEIHERHLSLQRRLRHAYRLEQLESLCRLWSWTPRIAPRSSRSDHDLGECLSRIEELKNALYADAGATNEVAEQIDATTAVVVEQLRARVPCDGEDILFNATSRPKRVFIADYPRRIDSQSSTRIITCAQDDHKSQCVAEVPAFGFAKVLSQPPVGETSDQTSRAASAPSRRSSLLGRVFGSRPTVAQEDGSMANEFMEIQIDPIKGHLRSLYVVNKRGNRLSGQLSWVPEPIQLRHPFQNASFQGLSDTRMILTHSSKARGTIEVTGRLGGGSCMIRYTLWHGAQWVDIEVQGSGMDRNAGFPVWRMVWPSEAATIAAWSQGAKGKLPAPLQCAVELIEIDDAEHRVHFATCGLSIHRRAPQNGLVSVVPLDGIGSCGATFSLGIDWNNPWETAVDRMMPEWISASRGTPQPSTGKAPDAGAWLARCNLSNLRFRWIDPAPALGLSDPAEPSGEGHDAIDADGCLWVTETAGKTGVAKIGCVRPIHRAWRVDFRGFEYDTLKVENGEVLVPFQGWERSRIALCFER